MFYFFILNLPPHLHSTLQNIFPLAVVITKYLKDNFEFVLREFMSEMHELESDNGMTLNVIGIPVFTIHEIIVQLCADSKGAHEIGGFMGTSANRFCIKCMISNLDIKHKSRPKNLVLRNRESHSLHVESAQQSGEGCCRASGVKCYSLIDTSKHFHMVENFCSDLLHDFFEGVIPFTFKIVIRAFIFLFLEMGFNAQFLNERITNLVYDSVDSSNKPSARFRDPSLSKIGDYNTKQKQSHGTLVAPL